MCKYGNSKMVKVLIPADLSYTNKKRLTLAPIDKCIAQIVSALQNANINMRSSCCGHGKGNGEILLEDGRSLIISYPSSKRKIYSVKLC